MSNISIEMNGATRAVGGHYPTETVSSNGNGAQEIVGQLTLPVEFPTPAINGNGVAATEQLGFAQRMAERGSSRVSNSWV